MNRPSAAPLPTPQAAARPAEHRGSFQRWHLGLPASREEEGWFLTYLDVMTLLLVTLVVVLAFAGPVARTETAAAQPVAAPAPPPAAVAPVPEPAPAPEPDPLAGLPLDQLGSSIEVLISGRTVSFRISSEILFASGEAGLTPAGQEVVGRLLPALRQAAQHDIVVEGHTDDLPIQTARFPSNWELAAGRAGSVVRFLGSQGIAPQRMRAIGYADTRAIAANDTPAGRAANRRVEIVLEARAGDP